MYTIVRPDMALESLIQYSESSNNPVQWIQFLRALDQPDLPGWPLITPIKIQMLKCEKCSLEFCSPINFRRHGRIHRRSLKVNKESHNLRSLLAEFWDKCSLAERKLMVSSDDIMLKKIPGSSVIEALAGALLEPGVWALPQAYLKAGSKLLDIIQARPLMTSISSEELFIILDDASEGTFLCTGAAEFVQNFVFDGEAANSLEFKNLVASTSFLFELQLVKAWVADKDAEALRCQKLLVEEEEAALKRQAKLLERRKQKKLRQKEHKFKEQFYASKQDISYTAFPADGQVLSEETIPSSASESGSNPGNGPGDLDAWVESSLSENKENEEHSDVGIDITDECADQHNADAFEPCFDLDGSQSFDVHCAPESGLQTASSDCLVADPDIRSKQEIFEQRNRTADGPSQDISEVGNGMHMGSGHNSLESGMRRATDQPLEEHNNCKVVIGSIFVPLNSVAIHQLPPSPVDVKSKVRIEQTVAGPYASQTVAKAKPFFFGSNHVAASNLQKPGTEGSRPSEVVVSLEVENRAAQNEILAVSAPSKEVDELDKHKQQPTAVSDGNAPSSLFSAADAKKFLTQRWKQTMSTDHVKLSLDHECQSSSA